MNSIKPIIEEGHANLERICHGGLVRYHQQIVGKICTGIDVEHLRQRVEMLYISLKTAQCLDAYQTAPPQTAPSIAPCKAGLSCPRQRMSKFW